MALVTFMFGLILVALGWVGYEMSDRVSMTALIPSAAGIPWLLLGLWGIVKSSARKHAMHLAAMVSLLMIIVSIGGVISMDRKMARMALLVMAAMAVVHLILCVRSFIRVRQAKEALKVEEEKV